MNYVYTSDITALQKCTFIQKNMNCDIKLFPICYTCFYFTQHSDLFKIKIMFNRKMQKYLNNVHFIPLVLQVLYNNYNMDVFDISCFNLSNDALWMKLKVTRSVVRFIFNSADCIVVLAFGVMFVLFFFISCLRSSTSTAVWGQFRFSSTSFS